jgi:hypothetical protein
MVNKVLFIAPSWGMGKWKREVCLRGRDNRSDSIIQKGHNECPQKSCKGQVAKAGTAINSISRSVFLDQFRIESPAPRKFAGSHALENRLIELPVRLGIRQLLI